MLRLIDSTQNLACAGTFIEYLENEVKPKGEQYLK
jgi:hypothetical protein